MSLNLDIFQMLSAPKIHNTKQAMVNFWPNGELRMTSKKCGLLDDTAK